MIPFPPDQADQAQLLEERERAAGLARVAAELGRAGDAECRDCGDPIAAARRLALPSATRCAPCQEAHEYRRLATRTPRGAGALALSPGDFR